MSEKQDKTPANDAPTGDFHDRKDADRKELIVYGLGGVIDDIGSVGFKNLSALLVIGFGFSPIIAGMFGGLKTLWDGLMDPIVAHISDNFRSPWGRRRPFILAGSLLMGLFSWITWTFLPSNDRVKPNEPVVPVVYHAEADLAKFGKLLLAYGAPQSAIRVEVVNDVRGIFDDKTLSLYLEKIFADLSKSTNASVTLAGKPVIAAGGETPTDSSAPKSDAVLTLRVTSATPVPAGGDPIGFRLSLAAAMTDSGESEATEVQTEVSLTNDPRPDLKETKTAVENLIDFFAGKPRELGLTWKSAGGTTLNTNIRAKRAPDRALVAGLDYTLIQTLGTFYGVPYWRSLPDGAVVAEPMQARLAETAIARAVKEPDRLKDLLRVATGTPSDPILPAWASSAAQSEYRAGFVPLWQNVDLEKAIAVRNALKPAQPPKEQPGMWNNITAGFASLAGSNPEDRKLLWFVLAMFVLISFGNTLYSAAYYALGIEIAPSYDGRTRAMAYRSFITQIMNIIGAGFLPFCLLPIFSDFREGSRFLSTSMLIIGVPLSLWCFFGTRERTVLVRNAKDAKPSFFRSVREIGSSLEFWRISGLFFILGNVLGIFNVFGTFIVVYYVFGGNLLLATTYGAVGLILFFVSGTAAIPLVVWLCDRFEKQNALRIVLALLLFCSAVKYFCYTPAMPELILIQSFFYGIASAGVYNILPTLMADMTDLDELRCGERREGMFGAVVSIIMKSTSSLCGLISGVLVVAVGFQIERGPYQAPGVFHTMLIFFSIVPAVTGLVSYAMLIGYPLTRARCAEIKEQLAANREAKARENEASPIGTAPAT
jgi:GPH family glycoside/pentoside/hexuronide:cation symporter